MSTILRTYLKNVRKPIPHNNDKVDLQMTTQMDIEAKQKQRFQIISYEEIYAAFTILASSMVCVSFLMK